MTNTVRSPLDNSGSPGALEIIPAAERHYSNFGWLQTYWIFSFSDYHDPKNVRHGMLRVFNDDVVQPRQGFGTHPHEEMEIVTIVLSGEVAHEDSMGNRTVIRAGDVQHLPPEPDAAARLSRRLSRRGQAGPGSR